MHPEMGGADCQKGFGKLAELQVFIDLLQARIRNRDRPFYVSSVARQGRTRSKSEAVGLGIWLHCGAGESIRPQGLAFAAGRHKSLPPIPLYALTQA